MITYCSLVPWSYKAVSPGFSLQKPIIIIIIGDKQRVSTLNELQDIIANHLIDMV